MNPPLTDTNQFNDAPHMETQSLDVIINNKTVCQGLDIKILPGEQWGILGVNGIGKTTLLYTLAGLRKPENGDVLLQGKKLSTLTRRHIAKHIGVLLQNNIEAFPSTVLETALIGRHPYLRSWQWESRHDNELAKQALALVDLAGMESRMTDTLSGGEYRRLSLASIVSQNPSIYLLDEPTNHLDLHHQINILDMLKQRIETNKQSAIMILHDLNLAQRYCDKIILLFGEGETLAGPTSQVLTAESLSRLFKHPTIKVDTPNGPAFLPG